MSERELEKIFRQRQRLIDLQQKQLLRKVGDIEKEILKQLFMRFLDELNVSDGVIKSGRDEIKLSEAIDKIFKAFEKNQATQLAKQISSDLSKTFQLNVDYYEGIFDTTSNGGRFSKISKNVYAVMKSRLGIEGSALSPDGYLDRLIKNVPLAEQVKQLTFKAISGNMTIKNFTKSLESIVTGTPEIDGSLTKYYKGFAYDTYQQFDRATNDQFAKRLDLTYFIYSGGLIETSREFCIKRNDKVFSVEETKEWINDPDLPKTKAEKDSGNVTNYIPTIDCGRYNCRHMVRYISESLAKKLQPDLFEVAA